MPQTDVDVVNEAGSLIGYDGNPVTGSAPTFDTSTLGKIAARVYVSCVQGAARQHEWDFSRQIVALTVSGNSAPFPFTQEYLYPPLAVQVWQLTPTSLADPFDPQPIDFTVGNAQVSSVSTKVIWSTKANAFAVYNGLPPVAVWDASFRAAVVRLLASEFAMAGAGKPETSQMSLESYSAFAAAGSERAS